MKISVAGAGAGKTTTMADKIVADFRLIKPHQNIYCLAFTNNAVSRIKEKISEHYNELPKNIIVCTIHSFLYQEIIRPYYFLLYGKQYECVSSINLPTEAKFRNKKISELDDKGILHVTAIPQRAMWVVAKKYSDKKREKAIRGKILKLLPFYCGKIFIDEAQDIDDNILEVILSLESIGVPIELVGDPKQDLRGHGSFRRLVTMRKTDTVYLSKCYRCPQQHLKISNALIAKSERQESEKAVGTVNVVFESETQVPQFLEENQFDLAYISERNERFETHSNEQVFKNFDTLVHEIEGVLADKMSSTKEIAITSRAYCIARRMSEDIEAELDPSSVIRKHLGTISKQQYAKIITVLQGTNKRDTYIPVVSTIEGIKGQEGDNCLFILTTDLAPYLFGDKTAENKTKNKLYVALTRSLNKLTIFITQEVENKYGMEYIHDYFSKLLSEEQE